MEAKYISFTRRDNTDVAVMFSSDYSHKEMRDRLVNDKTQMLGAGFVRVCHSKGNNVVFVAEGKSISLGIKSRSADTKLLNLILYTSCELIALP